MWSLSVVIDGLNFLLSSFSTSLGFGFIIQGIIWALDQLLPVVQKKKYKNTLLPRISIVQK